MSPLAIFARFLRFGAMAWGGPVAQIAMVREALVEREKWIEPARFNRLLAAYQVLPGPEAHELCVHLGMIRGGRMGGIAAGLGFMAPGVILTLILAELYLRIDFGQPGLEAMFLGIQVAVIALIVLAVRKIGGHVITRPYHWLIAIGVFALSLAGLFPSINFVAAPSGSSAVTVAALFLAGLKAGLLTFGGAYSAIPFVRSDAVGRGWVSDSTFLDSLALTGMLPAPLIVFATFVGYVAAGPAGALAITAGIFLPAFAFALLFFDGIERVVERPGLHAMLDALAAGVVGMIAATAVMLAQALAGRLPEPLTGGLIFLSAIVFLMTVRKPWAVPALIPLAALAGLAAFA